MATVQSGFNISKPNALTGAAYTTVGGLGNGTYRYGMTFVTGFGETDMSTALSIAAVPASGSVQLTAIQVGSDNIIARRLYRTAVGGSTYFLLAELDKNTTTSYIDVATDASLSATQAPTSNTAHSLQTVNGLVGFSKPLLHSVSDGLVARAGGGQALATVLPSEYNLIATTATAADSVLLPVANTSTIGKTVIVKNNGVAAAAVFPTLGQTINGGSANASVSLAAGATATYIQSIAGGWVSF